MTRKGTQITPHARRPCSPAATAADELPLRPLRHHLALTVYWLGNSLLWGALLHMGLQSRLARWFAEDQVGYYYAIIGTLGALVGATVQIVAGTLSDRSLSRFGRRRPFLLVGVVAAAGALVLLGYARSFWPFTVAFVLLELFSNMALGPFAALLPDTVNPSEHGKASGFLGVARLLGDTGGLILAGSMLSTEAVKGVSPLEITAYYESRFFLMCLIMGGFSMLTAAISLTTIHEEPLRERPPATTWSIIKSSFVFDVKANRDFGWLSLSRAVTNYGFYIFLEILIFFLIYTLRVPDPEGTTQKLLLPAILAGAAGSYVSGVLSDRVGRRRLIFISQYTMALAAAGFALAPDLTWAYVCAIPGGAALGIFTAVEWALACNLLPREEAGHYLGIWNTSLVVPQILAATTAGAIGSGLSALGGGIGWRVDFAIVAACCLLGAYFLRFVHERLAAP